MPEDRVTETHVFKDLQVQFSQARGAAEHFRTMVENLTREIEDLRGSRRAFRSQEEVCSYFSLTLFILLYYLSNFPKAQS